MGIRWLASLYLVVAVVIPPALALWRIASDFAEGNDSMLRFFATIIAATVISAFWIMTALLLRVVVQSVEVMLDIEANTRRTADAVEQHA
jgi:hypothetical protein